MVKTWSKMVTVLVQKALTLPMRKLMLVQDRRVVVSQVIDMLKMQSMPGVRGLVVWRTLSTFNRLQEVGLSFNARLVLKDAGIYPLRLLGILVQTQALVLIGETWLVRGRSIIFYEMPA
jgi:hypothetical protein